MRNSPFALAVVLLTAACHSADPGACTTAASSRIPPDRAVPVDARPLALGQSLDVNGNYYALVKPLPTPLPPEAALARATVQVSPGQSTVPRERRFLTLTAQGAEYRLGGVFCD